MCWNSRLPVPIEVFNGRRLTRFLQKEEYLIQDISSLIKPRVSSIGKPRKALATPIEEIPMNNTIENLTQNENERGRSE